MRLKFLFFTAVFFIFGFLYETKQFASWTRLSRLPIQLKTTLLRVKQKNKNFFKTIQRGKHRVFSFLTNLMNRYRFDHAAEKKQILLLAPSSPVALLPTGSLVFTRHQVIREIEQKMFERIKNLLDLSDTEYENMLKGIEEIREKKIEELVSSSGPNFSDTHQALPEDKRKIFYELCNEYNINPKNIYITIDNTVQGSFVSLETINELKNPVITLTIGLESISHLSVTKKKALLAHELAHVVQADAEMIPLFIDIMQQYYKKNNYSEQAKNHCLEAAAVCTYNVEKIADILFASRNTNHARTMGIFRDIASDAWKKDILQEIFEPLTSKKRYKPGYPLLSEKTCWFIKNMEEIWGKNFLKKIKNRKFD